MIGKTISHYKILEKLGEGGMGEVYLAEDTKLKRQVAIKFLPLRITINETDKARFLQEAQSAAAINHPNVCVIYEIQDQDENPFIVMEYVDGQTLSDKIASNPLPIEQIIEYSIQVAEALQAAHDKGIVHRDIKADNIMISKTDQIKVMDFGLAKLRGSIKLTKTTSTVGTLAYMSPEQIEGKKIDARSDIFSFGVVLYEMLAGKMPFQGEYESAQMYSILNEEPEPVQKLRSDISSELLHVLNRSLEKNADDRYQNMKDIIIDLKRIKRDSSKVSHKVPQEILPDSSKMAKRNIQWISAASIVVICIVIFWLISQRGSQMQVEVDKNARRSIAVMPFENLTGDENYDIWQKGIPILLESALSTSQEDLYVMDSQSTLNVLEDMRQGQTANIMPSLAKEVASKLNVETFIMGTIFSAGDRIRLHVKLQDVNSSRILTTKEVEGTIQDDFLDMAEKLSDMVKNYLEIKMIAEGKGVELRNVLTDSAEAYRHYLRGRETFGDFQTSIQEFIQAATIDTNFTWAQLYVALQYNHLAYFGNTAERLKEANKWAKKAYSRKDKLPYKYQLYLEAHYCEFKKTPYERINWIKKILKLDTQNRELLYNLGWIYYRLEQYRKAIDPLKKAIELTIQRRSRISYEWDPAMLGLAYHALGEHDKELELYENFYLNQGPEKFPENPNLFSELVSLYLCQKDTAKVQYYLNRLQQVLVEQGASEAQIKAWFGISYQHKWGFYHQQNEESLDQAEAYYRQAIAIDPNGASIEFGLNGLNLLAFFLIDNDRDVDEGVKHALRAVQIDSENPFSLHALGWGYHKQGKYELAVETLQKAEDLIPKYDHYIRKHLEEAQSALAKQ